MATSTISTANFFTIGSGSTADIIECNNYNPSNSKVIYNLSGQLPMTQDGYHDLAISGTVSSSSNFILTGDFSNSGSFTSLNSGNNITFNGSTDQSISGTGIFNFKNITFNSSNSSNKLNIASSTLNIDESIESSSGVINQNGGNIILKSSSPSSAGLIKVNSSSDYVYNSGTFTVERYYNASSNGWRMISSPLNPSTLSDWDDEFTYCGVTGGTGNFGPGDCNGFYSVLAYSESAASPDIDDGFLGITSLTHSVANANGTLIYANSGATTISVTGTPNFSTFNKLVTKVNDGWNLVANPYPSTLDWTNGSTGFYDVNSSIIDNARYIYQGDLGNYTTGASDISHSQGFWVKASSNGNLSFNPNQTINSPTASFIKSSNGINIPLKLFIKSNINSYGDYASVVTGPTFSNNYDAGQDIFKLFSPNPDYVPNIFFLDNLGNTLDRTCINNNQSVDILLDARIGRYSPGNYTIDFENLNQFMIGSCISLEDLHTGIVTDLRRDSSYTFISDTLSPSPRFRLSIDVEYDINVTNLSCFQDSSGSIKLAGSGINGSYFTLLDTLGVLLDSLTANQDTIVFANLRAGIYKFNTNNIGSCSVSNQEIVITQPESVQANFSLINDSIFIDSLGTANVFFKNLSSGSDYYQWNFGDNSFSNDHTPSHIYNNTGFYTVSLSSYSDSNQTCFDSYQKVLSIINPFSNIQGLDAENLVEIENFGNILKLKILDNKYFNSNFKIFDLSGRIVCSGNIQTYDIEIDISSFSSGIFYLGIYTTTDYTISKAFIKN